MQSLLHGELARVLAAEKTQVAVAGAARRYITRRAISRQSAPPKKPPTLHGAPKTRSTLLVADEEHGHVSVRDASDGSSRSPAPICMGSVEPTNFRTTGPGSCGATTSLTS
jgi:hypothetical protein